MQLVREHRGSLDVSMSGAAINNGAEVCVMLSQAYGVDGLVLELLHAFSHPVRHSLPASLVTRKVEGGTIAWGGRGKGKGEGGGVYLAQLYG